MSSPSKQPSPSSDNDAGNGEAGKKRLTEAEKRRNHVLSEQKRRETIRGHFDQLSQIVPGLEGQARSEGAVLTKTVDFIMLQLEERARLVAEVKAAGGKVDESLERKMEQELQDARAAMDLSQD